MQTIDRNQLKTIFKKVKKFRLPESFDDVNFAELNYYGWLDETDRVCYVVYEYNGKFEGVRFEYLRSVYKPLLKGFCVFCCKQRRKEETLFITAKTKKLPKSINYRTRGNYICSDFAQCNRDMKDMTGIDHLFHQILEQE